MKDEKRQITSVNNSYETFSCEGQCSMGPTEKVEFYFEDVSGPNAYKADEQHTVKRHNLQILQVFAKVERDVILSTGGELAFDRRDSTLH